MKKNNKTPKLRFSGYTDDWEQRKLGEITELKSASRVHKDEWTSNGVPFYRSSDVMAAINGTENEKAFISEELYEKLSKVSGKLEEGDILVTGGGSVGNPYIVLDNKPLYTKDADLLWIKNKGKFHPYFLYEFFFSPTFRNYLRSISHVGTIAHYTITQLSDTPIYLPSFEEQKEVGEYFQSLDHLITLHQRKLEKLQNMKKSCLQKMFPKDGATVPEIRFSEFQEDWEERTLGSCFDERLESLPDGELLSVTIGSGIKKFSELDRHNNSNTDKSKYKRVCIGDIAYNSMRMWQGASGRSPYEGIVSPAYTVVKPIGDIDTQFFAYMFKKKEIIHLFEINSQGLTSDTWNLKYPAFSKIVVKVPRNVEEQSRIARFLLELDELISCTEQEIEITKRMKKGCLQKMFV